MVFDSYQITVERAYKESAGGFKSIDVLNVNDIPKAILALKKAFEYCVSAKNKEPGSGGGRDLEAFTPAGRIP